MTCITTYTSRDLRDAIAYDAPWTVAFTFRPEGLALIGLGADASAFDIRVRLYEMLDEDEFDIQLSFAEHPVPGEVERHIEAWRVLARYQRIIEIDETTWINVKAIENRTLDDGLGEMLAEIVTLHERTPLASLLIGGIGIADALARAIIHQNAAKSNRRAAKAQELTA